MNNIWALLKLWAEKNIFYSFTNANIGVTLSIRKRFTIAEVNAGAALLPALLGYKYRMIEATIISVGGAAAAATTIDILATAAAASRKLLAVTIGVNFTQSKLMRAGATDAAVLADGASFTANDDNTAVTVGKTGSDVTTATHVDVIFNYVIEKA